MVVRPSALQCGGDKNAPQALFKSICVQYGRLFRRKMPFVASTAKRQRGLQRGKLGSPLPCFASFCRSKRNAPAASRTGFAPCKIFATPLGDPQSCPEINIFCPPFSHASAYSSTATGFLARSPAPISSGRWASLPMVTSSPPIARYRRQISIPGIHSGSP